METIDVNSYRRTNCLTESFVVDRGSSIIEPTEKAGPSTSYPVFMKPRPQPKINVPEPLYKIPEGYSDKQVGRRTLCLEHLIQGEPFLREVDGDEIILSHSKWSLVGIGSTVLEAEADLLDEVHDLTQIYLTIPVESLDQDGYRLRNFLLRAAH